MTKRRIISGIVFCVILCLATLPGAAAEAATKVGYEILKEELTWKDGDTVRGTVSFQYPKLKGTSKEIAKINQVLENAMKTFMDDERVEGIKETTLYYMDNKLFSEDVSQLYWKTTCKITYNANHVISMHMKEMWYAGGVYNQKDYGYTFDVTTGKALSSFDAVGGKPEEVTKKVLAGAKKYFKIDQSDSYAAVWKSISTVISNYDAEDFKFYLIPGKVRICFESYELNCGSGYQVFSVAGKYQ